MANEFHKANVGLMAGKKTFGLYNYKQIAELYNEIQSSAVFLIYKKIRRNQLTFDELELSIKADCQQSILDDDYLERAEKIRFDFPKKFKDLIIVSRDSPVFIQKSKIFIQ